MKTKAPIIYYLGHYCNEFHEELFLKLIPNCSMTIVLVIGKAITGYGYTVEYVSPILTYLLQYLIATDLNEISLDLSERRIRNLNVHNKLVRTMNTYPLSYYNSNSVCLYVSYLLRGPLADLRQTWWVHVGGPPICP